MIKLLFSRQRPEMQDLLEHAKQEKVAVDVHKQDVLEKIRLIDLTRYDLQLLKTIRPFVEAEIEETARTFYASFYHIEALKKIIDAHSTVKKLTETLAPYVLSLFSGVIDDAFISQRYRVGKVHYRIGLVPSYYMGTFQSLQNSIARIVFQSIDDGEAVERVLKAITKVFSLEQQIVLDAYQDEYRKNLRSEYEIGRDDLKKAIAEVCAKLTDLSHETHETVKELARHFRLVKAAADESSRETAQASRQAAEGQAAFEKLSDEVRKASDAITEMEKKIDKIEDTTRQIGILTVMTKDISEKTNILSLNSAIEAARAGEAGKGFTVVSDEIRKLADETNQAMTQMSELVSTSTEATTEVVASIESVGNIVADGMKRSHEAGNKFEEIIAMADRSHTYSIEINQKMDVLGRVTKELEKGAGTMLDAVDQLNRAL